VSLEPLAGALVTGLVFTAGFILLSRSVQIFGTKANLVDSFFGITAQGIGTIGMLLNFAVTIAVSLFTLPPVKVQQLINTVRYSPHRVIDRGESGSPARRWVAGVLAGVRTGARG
jgi:cation/acetate symporter